MMITNCAKMRSFNCFTFITGTRPPGAPNQRLTSPPKQTTFLRGAQRGVNEAHEREGCAAGNAPYGVQEERGSTGQAIDLSAAPPGSGLTRRRARAGEPDEVLDGYTPPAAEQRHGPIRKLRRVSQRRRQRYGATRLQHDLE